MNSIRYRTLVIALGIALCGHTQATGVVAGATEPTQIMNNVQLVGQHLKKVQSLAKRAQQYANQVKRLNHQVEMMRQLDPTKARDLLRGVQLGSDIAGDLSRRHEVSVEIGDRLSSLSDNLSAVYREGFIAANVMEDLQKAGHNISGDDYLGAMNALAQMRVDTYGKRMEHVRRASETALSDAENLKRIAEINPDIASEMEGLQAIIKTNENLGGLLAYNNQLISEQVIAQYELNQSQLLAIDEAHILAERKKLYFEGWFPQSPPDPDAAGSARERMQ